MHIPRRLFLLYFADLLLFASITVVNDGYRINLGCDRDWYVPRGCRGSLTNPEKTFSYIQVMGAVTDSSSGNPLPEVNIRLYRMELYGEQNWDYVSAVDARTDNLGEYFFRYEWMGGYDELTFRIRFVKSGYSIKTIPDIPCHERESSWRYSETDTINVQLVPITP